MKSVFSETEFLREHEPFLPLSWSHCTHSIEPVYTSLELPLNMGNWLAFANVPASCKAQDLAQKIHADHLGTAIVMRGVHPVLCQQLMAVGGQVALSGREALLDLRQGHIDRSSLKSLARRGLRQGEIVSFSVQELPQIAAPLNEFLAAVQETYPAALSYLYRQELAQSERFFVLRSQNQILGLISLISTGAYSWHTELLFRHPQSPVGIMDALVLHVFETLASEGALYWSLGEVPFYPLNSPQDFKSWALNALGHQLEPVYSAQGLYQFKAKFNPIWRPVYVYGSPVLTWRMLAGLFWRSNAYQLALAQGRSLLGSAW